MPHAARSAAGLFLLRDARSWLSYFERAAPIRKIIMRDLERMVSMDAELGCSMDRASILRVDGPGRVSSSEVLELRWRDLDLERGALSVDH